MNSTILEYAIILFSLELFELFWQRGSTLFEYIRSLLRIYQKSIVLFLFLHPSFYFMLFCLVLFNTESTLFLSMLIMKMIDIAMKIQLLDRLIYNKPLGFFEPMAKANQALPLGVKVLPAFLYSSIFYISFA